jgi:Transposase and inactivated derivatives
MYQHPLYPFMLADLDFMVRGRTAEKVSSKLNQPHTGTRKNGRMGKSPFSTKSRAATTCRLGMLTSSIIAAFGEITSIPIQPLQCLIEGKFKNHDTRKRVVKDVDSIDGKKVRIIINQRRYDCPFCKKRFSEYFEAVCRNDKVTVRLWERMGKEVLLERNTFRTVARRYGVSPTTVARAFEEHVENLDKERSIKAPSVLGIDEVFIKIEQGQCKQVLAVFTDIENKNILEIIKGNSKASVIKVIQSMYGYENIKAVTMDMNSTYRNAVKECVPNAYCVVDCQRRFNFAVFLRLKNAGKQR